MAEIRTKLTADSSELHGGLEKARAGVARFGSDMKSSVLGAVGGFVAAGAIIERTFSALNKFGDVGDLSERFKVSAESMQRLAFIAEQTGSSAESMAKGIGKIRLSLADAANGSKEAADVWASAGVSLESVRSGSVSAEDALYALATYVAATEDETRKLSIATSVFGDRLAGEILPILEQGGEGMRKLGESATVLSDDIVGTLKTASDAWKSFGNKVDAIFGYLAAGAVRLGAFFMFVAEAVPIIATSAAGLDFDRMTRDLEAAAIRAANRAYGVQGDGSTASSASGSSPGTSKADEKRIADEEKARKSLADAQRAIDDEQRTRSERMVALEQDRLSLLAEAERLGATTAAGMEKQAEAKRKELQWLREAKAINDETERKAKAEADAKAKADDKRRYNLDFIAKTKADAERAAAEKVARFIAPTVSSLQASGLGGNIAAGPNSPSQLQERANDLLAQINTSLAAMRDARGANSTPVD